MASSPDGFPELLQHVFFTLSQDENRAVIQVTHVTADAKSQSGMLHKPAITDSLNPALQHKSQTIVIRNRPPGGLALDAKIKAFTQGVKPYPEKAKVC